MCHRLLFDAKLIDDLWRIDKRIAELVRRGGCPCGGVLHSARYPRKPWAVGREKLPPEYEFRLSFCCAICRRRVTPPSVRFLGRKLYLGLIVVLVSALRQGRDPPTLERIQEELTIDPRTVGRWRRWWDEDLPRLPFWKRCRSRLPSHLANERLPIGLVRSFRAWFRDGMKKLLEFLSPMTTTSWRAC